MLLCVCVVRHAENSTLLMYMSASLFFAHFLEKNAYGPKSMFAQNTLWSCSLQFSKVELCLVNVATVPAHECGMG